MRTLRRLLLIAALLGSVLGGYVLSAGSATTHSAPGRQLASGCYTVDTPC